MIHDQVMSMVNDIGLGSSKFPISSNDLRIDIINVTNLEELGIINDICNWVFIPKHAGKPNRKLTEFFSLLGARL